MNCAIAVTSSLRQSSLRLGGTVKKSGLIKSRWFFEPPEASSLVAPASGLADFLLAAATAQLFGIVQSF